MLRGNWLRLIENQNLSLRVIQGEQSTMKTKTLQHEYNYFNKVNWKTWNDLKTLQNDHEHMVQNYNKMEQYNMQQEKTMTNLEQTYDDKKEQLIFINIDLEK